MMRFERILVAYDADPAGEQAREAFGDMSARMEPVVVPFGGDVNGFHVAGGKVALWVGGLVKPSSPPATHPSTLYPVTLVFNPGPGLPVIADKWRELEDGRWAVRFDTPEELHCVIEATKAIGEYPFLAVTKGGE